MQIKTAIGELLMNKFAHMADIHLGAHREPILEKLELKAFSEAMDKCVELGVDFREFSRYIMGNIKHLEFSIPEIEMKRNDNSQVRDKIMSIDPEKRKELKINKSTLWYQQKKIKEGKTLKVYNKKRVRIG
jgi:hypothetical protein